MDIELQVKTGTCHDNSCPARYKVTSAEGGYVIVGKRLDAATRAKVRNVSGDEDALWVPPEIIDGR